MSDTEMGGGNDDEFEEALRQSRLAADAAGSPPPPLTAAAPVTGGGGEPASAPTAPDKGKDEKKAPDGKENPPTPPSSGSDKPVDKPGTSEEKKSGGDRKRKASEVVDKLVNLPKGYRPQETGARGACLYKSLTDQLDRGTFDNWRVYKRELVNAVKSITDKNERMRILRTLHGDINYSRYHQTIKKGDEYAEHTATSDEKYRGQIQLCYGSDWCWANEDILFQIPRVFGVTLHVYRAGSEKRDPEIITPQTTPDAKGYFKPIAEPMPECRYHSEFWGRIVRLWFKGDHYQSLHPETGDWKLRGLGTPPDYNSDIMRGPPDSQKLTPRYLGKGFYQGDIVEIGFKHPVTRYDNCRGYGRLEGLVYSESGRLVRSENGQHRIYFRWLFSKTDLMEEMNHTGLLTTAQVEEKLAAVKFGLNDYAVNGTDYQSFPMDQIKKLSSVVPRFWVDNMRDLVRDDHMHDGLKPNRLLQRLEELSDMHVRLGQEIMDMNFKLIKMHSEFASITQYLQEITRSVAESE
jgi:hypothetical protein